MAVGLVLLAVLGTAVVLLVRHEPKGSSGPAAGQAETPPPARSSASPAASPLPSTPPGPWRYIATRVDDPLPVTAAELFPRRFTAGAYYGLVIHRSSKRCTAAVVGSALKQAVHRADCSQVLRATYVSLRKKQMGTIGVLNLRTFRAAEKAGRAAGPARFIAPLDAAKGPGRNLAKAAGLEEAEVKGHYLILVLADFTNLHSPRTRLQRRELEAFMTELIAKTVNVSLTSRMVSGHP